MGEEIWEENELSLPYELQEQWSIFLELCATRTWHAGGPNPITHQEILSWCVLTDTALDAWELDLVRQLDVTWLNAQTKSKNA